MEYEPPIGILVSAPGKDGPDKGESVPTIIPQGPEQLELNRFSEMLSQQQRDFAIMPCGFHEVELDKVQEDKTLNHLKQEYIEPELGRRAKSGANPQEIKPITQALIVCTRSQEENKYEVLLNDDVELKANLHKKYGEIKPGEELESKDIHFIDDVWFPAINEEDGFIWIRYGQDEYKIFFDLLPLNKSDQMDNDVLNNFQELLDEWMSELMATEYLKRVYKGVFNEDDTYHKLISDGWFPAPAIIPDTWARMKEANVSGEKDNARSIAKSEVDDEKLELMLDNWEQKEPFASDMPFLKRGVQHYKNGDFISSVSVLLPRIEGLGNRVLKMEDREAKRKLTDVMSDIQDARKGPTDQSWVGENLYDGFANVINDFFHKDFHPGDEDAEEKLGRHSHTHGGTSSEKYDQSYALKIILAIDALFFIIHR